MRRAHRLLAGLLAAGALLTATTGCAQSVDPIERLGRKAAQRVNRPPGPAAARPAAVHGDHGAPGSVVVVACGRPQGSGTVGRGRAFSLWQGRFEPGPGLDVERHGRHEGRELALRLTEC
ncbi:hypothetical protein ACIO3R_25475 [Streptomyces sp. NPDC087428]|uniref:hypothetical protein n=1 Tax=Streptomyces sp. NPDC087428 TaxID=3365788 RepID=UPI00382CBC17